MLDSSRCVLWTKSGVISEKVRSVAAIVVKMIVLWLRKSVHDFGLESIVAYRKGESMVAVPRAREVNILRL